MQNSVLSVINKLADMVIISALWVLCSLPLVTLGAASAALYGTVMKSIREDRGYGAATFWKLFRENLRPSLGFTLFCLLGTVVTGFSVYYSYGQLGGFAMNVYFVFSLLCLIMLVLVQVHGYALLGRFQLQKKEWITLLIRLSGGRVLSNFSLLCMLLLAAELAAKYPPLLVLGLPAALTFVFSFMEERSFRKYIRYEVEDHGDSQD